MRWRRVTELTVIGQHVGAATTPIATYQHSGLDFAIEDRLKMVAVDLHLNVFGQVHIGTYKQVSDALYIRDLPWVNVYFSLQRLPEETAATNVVKWQFRGYQCRPDKARDDRVCYEVVTTRLESDRFQQNALQSQMPHIIDRQSKDRRLQFELPSDVAPPSFPTQQAFYDCAYSNDKSSWCCTQSSQGSGGPFCWSMSKCTEEWSAWNQQNIVCCTESAGDCALTYKPPLSTAAPTPTMTPESTTSSPMTTGPATEDLLHDIPIHGDAPISMPFAPTTTAPVTNTPDTSVLETSAPITSAPAPVIEIASDDIPFDTDLPTPVTPTLRPDASVTDVSATRGPITDNPILAGIPAPATSTLRPDALVSDVPVTNAPVTGAPITDIPILADSPAPATFTLRPDAPVTDIPSTNAPATDVPVTNAPATDVPVTNAPATDVPVTNAPVTGAPISDIPILDDLPAPATFTLRPDAPVTDIPSTNAPATDVPVTNAPAIDVPVTNAPATDVPVTSAPVTGAPIADIPILADLPAPAASTLESNVPTTDVLVTNALATDVPVTSAPLTGAPITDISLLADLPAPAASTLEPNAPTTDVPVTSALATDVPVTSAPVTGAPISDIPILDDLPAPATFTLRPDAPVTDIPSTNAPATDVPVTNAPATDVPVTNAPATDVPVTSAPVTGAPIADIPILADLPAPATSTLEPNAPTTDVPVTSAPVTGAPITDNLILADLSAPAASTLEPNAPTTDVPVTSALATDVPVTSAPVTGAPITDISILADLPAPATSTLTLDAPVTDVPVTNAPAMDVPVTSAPMTGAPIIEPPVTPAPATETSVSDIPILSDTPTLSTSAPVTGSPIGEPVTAAPVVPAPVSEAPIDDILLLADTPAEDIFVPASMTGVPVAGSAVTSAPTTEDPVDDIPILAETLTPETPFTAPVTGISNSGVPNINLADTVAPGIAAPITFVPSSSIESTQPSNIVPLFTGSPASTQPPMSPLTITSTSATPPAIPATSSTPPATSLPGEALPTPAIVSATTSTNTATIAPAPTPTSATSFGDVPLLADTLTTVAAAIETAIPTTTSAAVTDLPATSVQPIATIATPLTPLAASPSSPTTVASSSSINTISSNIPLLADTSSLTTAEAPVSDLATPSTLEVPSSSVVPTNAGDATVPINSIPQVQTTMQPFTMPGFLATDTVENTPIAASPQLADALATVATDTAQNAAFFIASTSPSTNTLENSLSSSFSSAQGSDLFTDTRPDTGSLTNVPSRSATFSASGRSVASSLLNSSPVTSLSPQDRTTPSSLPKRNSTDRVASNSLTQFSKKSSLEIEIAPSNLLTSSIAASAIINSTGPLAKSSTQNEVNTDLGNYDEQNFHQAISDLAHIFGPTRDTASSSANILVAIAATTNIVSVVISIVTTGTAAVSSVTTGATVSQEILNTFSGGAGSASRGQAAPVVDLNDFFTMINYLQFLSSNSHLSLPSAPDFYFRFTDALGWCNLQSTSAYESTDNDQGKAELMRENVSSFTVADGDIISGVLAYAERIGVKPEELFTKTTIVFGSVVGGVAGGVAMLYCLLRLVLRQQLDLIVQRLDDLPRARLLMRLLIQSCLSICLLSEYALSMTSSFQMRYNEQDRQHKSYSVFAFATSELILVCCGLIVLGVVKIWNKSEDELASSDFKFAWGAYYKYYHYKSRFFFVAKMGAEILSGVIIGLVSDVPSQLTLLMALQLAMFLYTVECAPYSMEFQTVCSSTAFVMKMVTYALISLFLTPATDVSMQQFVGTLVIMLQVTLLVLFNSRQLYVLYKQIKFIWHLRQIRLLRSLEMKDKTLDATSVKELGIFP